MYGPPVEMCQDASLQSLNRALTDCGRRPVFHIGLFCNFAGLNLYGYEKCFV